MIAPPAATMRERIAALLERTWTDRGAVSAALLPAAWAFGAIAATRRQLFAHEWRQSSRLPVPVIVIGNVIVGGAGKTPTAIAVVDILRRHGYTPGIVSRGYGRRHTGVVVVSRSASADQVGDEPLLLHLRTGAPVAVGGDRVAAGHALLRAESGIDAIVSDDGLQHLALARDVEVLVFDERGAGNGRLLPAGPLRQPVPVALGGGQIVLYNADANSTALPGHLARRSLAGVVPLGEWWAGAAASRHALAALRERDVVAVAGLARPERFFAMLRGAGLRIVERPLPDHADFTTLPWSSGASDVVLTEKDAVKLPPSRALGTRVWVAPLDFFPDPAFAAALLALLPPSSSTDRHGNTPA